MPYFTKEYCKKLEGKTVRKITPASFGVIEIHWTDGTITKIQAAVEREIRSRQINLIVNTRD